MWLNSNSIHERVHKEGWEPEVLKCIRDGKWDGPIWDVGASFGRHAYRLAAAGHFVYAFEPNLNSLQFLGNNLVKYSNVVIVPCALTLDGLPMVGTFHPDFLAPSTGPKVATISLREALVKFGRPGLMKIDIEGGEYELLKSPDLIGITMMIEWHREIPTQLEHWNLKTIDPTHSLLTPK